MSQQRRAQLTSLVANALRRVGVVLLSCVVLSAQLAGVLILPQTANAAVPAILNYQLRLTDSTGIPVPDGTKSVKLTIYDAAAAGNQLYTACATGGSPVGAPQFATLTFTNGVASVLIGSTLTCVSGSSPAIPSTLFDNTTLFLGVTVDPDAEMTPRKRIASSGYALNADKLDGFDSSAAGGTTAFVPVTDSSGLLTLTGNPTTTAAVITANPVAAANELLIDLKNNGTSRFSVDGEGDVILSGNITNTGALTIATAASSALTLNVDGGNASGEDLIVTANNLSLLATGALAITPDNALATAIDLTDTDLTNALSVADNNIIGTTAAIDFTNFDVASTGAITVAPGVGLDTNGAGALLVGNTNATSVSICSTANCDTLTLGDAGDNTTTLNGTTVAIDSSDWDISTTGAMTNIDSINTIAVSSTALTFAGAGSIIPTTNSLTLGAAGMTALIVTTDGTGDAEVQLPAQSIGAAEIVDGALGGGDLADDSLDFVDFEDTLDLDAALTLNQTTNTWSQTFTGTTTVGQTYTANSLTSGSATSTISTNAHNANVAGGIAANLISSTFSQSTAAQTSGGGFNALRLNYTQTPTVAGNAENLLMIQNQVTTNTTDVSIASAILIDNADTNGTGSTVFTDALLITNSGGITSGIVDAVDASATEIDNAINIGANNILTAATTIASTELDRLDGKDAALVDTNDAVATAITGTGALNAGSITSGFGGIDVGNDTITTTGTVGTAGSTVFTGNTATFSGAVAANGGITFDNSTDTVGAHTLSGTIDAANNLIINVGNAGTDFVAGGGLTLAGAFTANGASTFNTDIDAVLAGTENIAITSDLAGTVDVISLIGTPSASAGTTRGIFVQQADSANANGLDTAVLIDNADTNLALTTGLLIQGSSTGAVTTAIDVSDAEIGTALAIGSNDITTGAATISSAELDRLDGKDAALVDTNDAVATAITGTGALNAGSITSGFGSIDVGNDTITTTGTVGTAGSTTFTGNTGTFSGAIAANGGITFDASTDTVGAHTLSGTIDAANNLIINIGNAGTDFVAGGGLTLAGTATFNGQFTLGDSGDTGAIDTSDWDISTTGALTGIGAITMDGAFSQTGATTFSTGTGAISINGSTTIAANQSLTFTSGTGVITQNFTPAANTSTSGSTIVFTTPADSSGTNVHQGFVIAPVIGNATAGTNSTNLLAVEAADGTIEGDAQMTLRGIQVGALTGTAASEVAINVGSGWDAGLVVNGVTIVDGAGNLTASPTIVADSLDYDDFEDTLDLDAALTLNQTTNTWSQTFTGTTTIGHTYTATSLTSGAATSTVTTNAHNANVAGGISANLISATFSQATTAQTSGGGFNALRLNYTQTPTIAGNTENVFEIQNQVTANTTDVAVSSLLLLDNADTNASGSTVITDAILITNSGAITSGIVDAIDASATEIDNAINIGSNNILTAATTIASTELDRLDGKDAALVDTNDAVATAITGTGALNAGSITSGFGSIDVGNDTITTTGTVFGNDHDRSTGGALTFGNTNATSVSICSTANCDTLTLGDAGDNTTTLNGTTVAIDSSDWDISTTGALTGIGAITMDGAFSQTGATTFSTGTGAISLNGAVTVAANQGLTFTSGTGVITQNFTPAANTSTNGSTIVFTTPADSSGTNVHQGFVVAPVIGNATAGTNTTNLLAVEAADGTIEGDAQMTLRGIQVGALTGTAASETAINVAAGWDNALVVNGVTIVDGTGAFVGTLNCTDCLDYDDLEDTLDLDAALTLNQTTNTWSQTFTGTTTVGHTYTANSLTSGSATSTVTTNTHNANAAGGIAANLISATFSQSTAAQTSGGGFNALRLNYTQTPTIAGNSENLFMIQNQVTTNTTDVALASAILIDNADTSGTGSTVFTDAILITNSGGITSGIVDAIDASATEIDNAINIGTNNILTAATTIASTELDRLDGKDAALVDTNDAVATAITGTGALNAGSITSGFGAIDVGADNITTSGTLFGNDHDRSTGGALTFGNTNATSVSICASSACDTITIGDAADNAVSINGTTLAIDTSDWDISTTGAMTNIDSLNTIGTSATALTFAGAGTIAVTSNSLTLGSGTATTLIVTTDGTGDGEVQLPSQSIGAAEIVDGAITGGDLTDDTLDFVDFEDTLDLDAALTLNQTTNTWSQTFTGTTTVGHTFTANSLTSGSATSTVSTNSHNANVAGGIAANLISATFSQSTAAQTSGNGFSALRVNYTQTPTIAGNTESIFQIQNQVTTNTTDVAIASALLIDNADTNGTGSTVFTDALLITNSGGITSGIVDAIDVSAAEIDNAINIGSNNIVTGATTISSAELDRLDGKDANLVDVNDAVTTAITGTGALGAGSITSGFGAIDVGADNITTTGTLFGNDHDRSTGGALTFGNTNATSVAICSTANCDTLTLGDAGDNTTTLNGTTVAIDSSDWDISTTGAMTNIDSINTIAVSSTALTFAGAGTIAVTSNSLTLGSGTATTLIVTTDGTGDGEVQLPSQSIGAAEIVDGAITGGDLTDDTLDFVDFEDTLDLDAALTLNQTTNTWSQTFTGTTTTGLTYTASSLTSGKALALVTTNAHNANVAGGIAANSISATFSQTTAAQTSGGGFNALRLNHTQTPTVAGNTENLLMIQNQVTTNTTDVDIAAALLIDNADTSGTGSTVFTDAILISNSGGIANGIVDAIDASAADISNALNAGANVIIGTTAQIDFTNFDVSTTGIIDGTNVTVDPSTTLGFDTNSAGALGLGNTTATSVNLCASAACDTLTIGDAGDNTVTINGTTVAVDTSDWDISTTGDLSNIGTIALNGTITQTGATSISTGTAGITANGTLTLSNVATDITTGANEALTITPNGSGDITFSIDADSVASFTASAAPGVDMVTITNSGQASTTTGVDGLQVTFGASNASGNAVDITPSFAGGANDALTYTVIDIDAFTPTNAAGTDTIQGLNVGALTQGADAARLAATAINVGAGWDNALVVNGVTIIDGTGAFVGSLGCTDCLDFDDFEDALDIDAATTIAFTATGAADPLTYNLTNNAGSATTQRAFRLINALTAQTNDVATEAMIVIDNADTSASGSTAITDAILITNSGGIANGVVDAIDASAADITNALNVGSNVIIGTTAQIDFTNFDVSTTGIIDGTNVTVDPSSTVGYDTNSGGTLAIGNTNATTVLLCSTANCDTLTLGDAGDNTTTLNGTTVAIDSSDWDISTTGAMTNIDSINTIAVSSTALTFAGAGSIIPTTNSLTLGAAGMTTLIVTTDGTGDGEVQLPSQSIGATEIVDNTLTGGDLTDDTLDYVDFEDTLDLDAALTLNQTTNTWSQTFTGTTTTGYTYTANSLTSGVANSFVSTNTHNANVAGGIVANLISSTFSQSTAAQTSGGGFSALRVNYTQTPTIAGNTENILQVQNQVTANTTDVAVSSLLLLDNADTNASGSTVITDAILVTNSGAITSGIVDAVDASAAEIDNALNIGSNNIVTGAATISSAELDRLDGKDAALVDTNDAVATAITGTGALNAGSITSGFGAIDTGADNITTTGTVFGNAFDRSTGGALTLGNTNATSVAICSTANCDTLTLGDAGDNTTTLNGTTVAIDSSDWDISTTGDLSGIGAIGLNGNITFAAAGSIIPTTNSLTLGAAGMTTLIVTTDGTGDGEVQLPSQSIGAAEIVDGALLGGDVADDTLDYVDFEDTMDLDAALTLNQTTNTWSQTFTGTTTTGDTYTANSLTSGTAKSFVTTNTHNANAAGGIAANLITSTFSQSTAAQTSGGGFSALRLNYNQTPTIAGNTENVFMIQNQVTANTTDLAVSSALLIDNADTSASGSTAITDGILLTVSGTLANGIVDAIDASDANITNALNAGANAIVGTSATIDFTSFDVDSSGIVTSQGYIVGDAQLSSNELLFNTTASITADGGNMSFTALSGSSDILFIPADDLLFSLSAPSEIDVTVAASTVTTGVIDINVDTSVAGGASAINTLLVVNNGATGAEDFIAHDITLQADDADADLFGMRIVASATATAAANSYDAGILIDNQENTNGSMIDGIRITSTQNTGITDGIDVSDAEITNAINVGANIIAGAGATIDFTSFDVSAAGALTAVSLTAGSLTGLGTGDLDISGAGGNDIRLFVDGTSGITVRGSGALTEDAIGYTAVSSSTTGVDGMQISFTQDDDADATDTNMGLQVAITGDSVDADTLVGIGIANLAGASAGALSTALSIGSGWDANLLFNDTSTQVQVADGGTITFEDVGGTDIFTLVDAAGVAANHVLTGDGNTGLQISGATTDLTTEAAGALTIESGTTGTITIGGDASAETVNISTGAAAKTLNLGTATAGSQANINGELIQISSGTSGTFFGTTAVGSDAWLFFTNTTTTANGISLSADSITTGNVLNLSGAALTTGSAISALAGLSPGTAGAGQTGNGFEYTVSNINATNAATINGIFVDWAQSASVAGNTESLMRLRLNSNTGAATDAAFAQGLLIENLDTATGNSITMADAIVIQATTDTFITDGLDVSDAELVNGVNLGANVLLGTTSTIDFTNFDVSSTGSITTGSLASTGISFDISSGVGSNTSPTIAAFRTANTGAVGGTGLGSTFEWFIEDSGSNSQVALDLDVRWLTATNGAEDTEVILSGMEEGTLSDWLHITASGTNPIVGIGNATPAAMLDVHGDTPASIASTPGTSSTTLMILQGGNGGATTIGTTGTGGTAGGVAITTGTGGAANSATTTGTGGNGGQIQINAGSGGTATAAGGSGTRNGGDGGDIIITSGTGGAASGGATNNGGDGGNIILDPGLGAGTGVDGGVSISTAGTAGAAGFLLDVAGFVQLNINGAGGDTTIGACKDVADSAGTESNVEIVDCTSTPGDVAEWYETTGAEVEGDIVAVTSSLRSYTEELFDPNTGLSTGTTADYNAAIVAKTTGAYREVLGVVSTSPLLVMGEALKAVSTHAKPIAVVGRVPTKVTAANGAIAAGDPIATSAVAGVGMKATLPGSIIGYALEPASVDGTIQVFVRPGWYAGTAIGNNGANALFTTDFIASALAPADATTTAVNSHGLTFAGSAWDATAGVALDRGLTLTNIVTDKDTYRLSVANNAGAEIAYFGQNGDLGIAGKLFLSDRGAMQNGKYIYYDGSSGPGGDFIRTNAAGWGTGSYDFAEMFPSTNELQPGDLVMVDTTRNVGMTKAVANPASPTVLAGIVSTRPGFLAGTNDPGAYPIALSGRVPTKVSVANGTIAVGDAITVSAVTPGVGAKATTGAYVVGFALEPANTDGTIQVFVQPGWFNGTGINAPAPTASQQTFSSSTSFDQNVNMNGNSILAVGGIHGVDDIWSVDEHGVIKAKEIVVDKVATKKLEVVQDNESQMVGEGTLLTGNSVITIDNPMVTANSRIFVSFLGNTEGNWWISRRQGGQFELTMSKLAPTDLKFEYMIVNVQDNRTALDQQPEQPPVIPEAPTEEPPAETPPAEEPVVETPPAEEPPAEEPPAVTLPPEEGSQTASEGADDSQVSTTEPPAEGTQEPT
jgi:hypothetical protein